MPGMETPGNVLDPSRKKAKSSEAMVVMLRTPSSDTTLDAASFTRWAAAPLVQAECPGGNPTGRPSALLWRHSWHWRRWGFVCDVRHVMRRDVQAGPRRR
mmetsp:Transcript_87678/g.281434  ORF Transcript_87678/g.281434 Transcript_87678/m.281434 type:complete len:100 (-) Transcript_87678:5-304(-)